LVGVFGCVLKDGNAGSVVYEALKRLEHRGYDSVGAATIHEGAIYLKKDHGKIDEVHARHGLDHLPGKVGLGHIRWATHGAPLQVNAHPHLDCKEKVAVAQNGIIENYAELKKELEEAGHVFKSKTDTEVVSHLVEEKSKKGLRFEDALRDTLNRLEGSFSVAVMSVDDPERLFFAQKENTLTIGVGKNAMYCSSDIPTFLPMTNEIVTVESGEAAILDAKQFEIRKFADWSLVSREPKKVDWVPEIAEKEGFPHYMLKEIHAQPVTLRSTIRLQEEYLNLMTTFLDRAKELFLVACGTSYHACLAASYMFSKMASLNTHPVYASEFIEQVGKSVNIDSTILALSQSGETADTLAAVDYARVRAATILGLTNVVGSTLTRVSRAYIVQQAGPEIGVAATKTFTAQLSVLAQLALRLAEKRGKLSHIEMEHFKEKLKQIPEIAEKVIKTEESIVRSIAKKYKDKPYFIFLGRGISSAVAYEGRLKLMETNYIPSMASPAAEVEPGVINLMKPGYPVFFICPRDETRRNIIEDIKKAKAEGASIISVVEEGDEEIKALSDDYIQVVKDMPEYLCPIEFVIPLQLFAYYTAIERGLDPDKPRHLTKAVTVK
jgi:glucosamine--fructose-6-phosphate aminotransferase (isomerizing)